jgi:hypothetical protein
LSTDNLVPDLDRCDPFRKSKLGIFILSNMKDAYYFPHYCNARNDRKIRRVMKTLGVEGYGIYFMLLEVLRDQTEYRYPMQDVDLLAEEFGTSEAKVVAVIKNFGLFDIDEDEMFFSLNLIKYLEPMFKMRDQRSIAGKASAEARRQKMLDDNKKKADADFEQVNDRSTTVQRMLNENEQSKGEYNKLNETKPKENTYTPEFEHVWELYGRKGSKKQAYDEWKKLSQADKDTLLDHVPRYVEANEAEPQYMKDFERYIKHQTFHSAIIERPRKNIFSGSL